MLFPHLPTSLIILLPRCCLKMYILHCLLPFLIHHILHSILMVSFLAWLFSVVISYDISLHIFSINSMSQVYCLWLCLTYFHKIHIYYLFTVAAIASVANGTFYICNNPLSLFLTELAGPMHHTQLVTRYNKHILSINLLMLFPLTLHFLLCKMMLWLPIMNPYLGYSHSKLNMALLILISL